MLSQVGKFALLFVSSFILVVSFQNCGQGGSLTSTADTAGFEAPLVADVVNEMQGEVIVDLNDPAIVKEEMRLAEMAPEEVPEEVKYEEVKKEHEQVKKENEPVNEENEPVNEENEPAKEEYQPVAVAPVEELLNDYACGPISKDGTSKKVLICHYPPGNPSARHEICISKNALAAHQSHGNGSIEHQDHLGKCDSRP